MIEAKKFEADDPYALVGQGFPCDDGYDSVGIMAKCFVEEFALLGYSPVTVLNLFRSPYYQGPHGVFLARGEDYVRDLISGTYCGLHGEEMSA